MLQKSARSLTCKSEKTRKNYGSVISLYNKVGPQAAICRFASGFTIQPQMRYPVPVQISALTITAALINIIFLSGAITLNTVVYYYMLV